MPHITAEKQLQHALCELRCIAKYARSVEKTVLAALSERSVARKAKTSRPVSTRQAGS